jgi:serine/threonine-protein kinase
MLADGRYKLISRIAVGGMGEVWRAHDLSTDGPVAIKVLRPEFTGDEVSLKRLRIEARNASLLNHPNITSVHDYREHQGTGYLVMEYVDGQSLADVLAAHATIAPLRLLPILIQSSLGLHAAHSAGVVHRDVKPGNILLGPSDHVKLTDFGISVAHGQLALTDAGKVMGTAQYLSPEQALGNPATPASDLYSLGVIAYEALVGRRPFGGANYVAIALAQVNEQPPALPGSVERSLAALVMRLLDKNSAVRPTDGAELAGLLGEVLQTHRHLAGRLLAGRSGAPAGPLLRSSSGSTSSETVFDTAEQAAVPPDSLMPPPAPATDVGPAVASAQQPYSPPPGVTSPVVSGPDLTGAAATPSPGPAVEAGITGQNGGEAGTGQTEGVDGSSQAIGNDQPDLDGATPRSGSSERHDAAGHDAAGHDDVTTGDDAANQSDTAGNADILDKTGVAEQAAKASRTGITSQDSQEDAVASSDRSFPAADGEAEPSLATGTRPNRRRRGPPRLPIAPLPPVAEMGLPPMPVPPASELVQPLESLHRPRPEGPDPAGQTGPTRSVNPASPAVAMNQSDGAEPGRRHLPISRDWIWPALVGLGLLIIILIGLLTALNADSQGEGPGWLEWPATISPGTEVIAAVGSESIVSTVPELGLITER